MLTYMVMIEPSCAEEGGTDVTALRWPLVAFLPANVQLIRPVQTCNVCPVNRMPSRLFLRRCDRKAMWGTAAWPANRWFPTGASMSPLHGWSGRPPCATNPVGCERPYRGREAGFSGWSCTWWHVFHPPMDSVDLQAVQKPDAGIVGNKGGTLR